ncbi:unnamed protein product, partial [Rotaria magnacalcarata]
SFLRSSRCEHIRVARRAAACCIFLVMCFGCDESSGSTYDCGASLRNTVVLKLGVSISVVTSSSDNLLSICVSVNVGSH